MKHQIKSIAIGAALFALSSLGSAGCGGGDDSGPLGNIQSLIILQRPKRNDNGDIFQYTSYVPGARLVQLQPPTADGTLTPICCDQDPDFKDIDIQAYDISFDAKSIVFSARRGKDPSFGLFLLQLDGGSLTQIATNPMHDFVSPIFLPGDYVMFTSNDVVEAGAKQHRDEYERGETSQLGRVKLDGSGMELGPRNLSHRTAPSLASDGRVVFTQWDHLGGENSGHLMFVNQDMQELREGYGKEGTSPSNSTLKAHEISPGRFVAIATARNRTLNAGALIDIRLGDVQTQDGVVSAPTNQSEAHATFRQLTPDVPMDNMPSSPTVGRYYDAYPLNAKDKPDLLVSWADGAVESGVLASAGVEANFGVYLLDTEHQQRRPILDDPDMWDVFAMPLRTRSAPNVVSSAQDPKLGGQTLIGSLNVYNSTLHTFKPGEIFGVRVMEGFSSEEGFPEDFGTTMFEGHANLGVAPVSQQDGSWSALIPANVPVHLQAVDIFGMALFSEPVWFSGRAGEARMCGGCHEDRTRTTNVQPGQLETFAKGASPLMGTVARNDRQNPTTTDSKSIVGVAWDKQLQTLFTTKCVACHGDDNKAGVASYTITDPTGVMAPVTWTFNLTGAPLPPELAVAAGMGAYSKSYFSMAGPDMEAIEKAHLMITGNYKTYMKPLEARSSDAITLLNPVQVFPADGTARAFATTPHLADPAIYSKTGVAQVADLTPFESYLLVLAADMGVNFFARENNPHTNQY
ncbi:MAG TPA: hypothetical protein VFK02_12165 [Kofleriaceae bacterium]|nr:hypothetical protein [Kofleriaceae bacterium]